MRGWIGARVDTRALMVLRSKAAQSSLPAATQQLTSCIDARICGSGSCKVVKVLLCRSVCLLAALRFENP